MNAKFLTEYGKNQIEDIKNNYPELLKYYEEMMGNFAFEIEDLKLVSTTIEKYQIAHPDFVIVIQSGTFYLTNSLD